MEVVCLVRGFHRQAAATVTAGALGYYGPFGEVMVAVMPGGAPVAHGCWTRPMPCGEADASAFCTSAVAAIEVGHNTGALPALQVHSDKNCQRCIQKEAGVFTPSQIMTCLAPIQYSTVYSISRIQPVDRKTKKQREKEKKRKKITKKHVRSVTFLIFCLSGAPSVGVVEAVIFEHVGHDEPCRLGA